MTCQVPHSASLLILWGCQLCAGHCPSATWRVGTRELVERWWALSKSPGVTSPRDSMRVQTQVLWLPERVYPSTRTTLVPVLTPNTVASSGPVLHELQAYRELSWGPLHGFR